MIKWRKLARSISEAKVPVFTSMWHYYSCHFAPTCMTECNRWKQFQVLQNKHLLLWFSGPPNQPNTEQITRLLIFPWFHSGLLHNPKIPAEWPQQKKVQINTRKFICVSVEVGWLSQISGSVAKLSPLPSTISFGATTFIYQRKQKMSNGNNSGDWHQFIFRTWLWQLREFFPPGDGGLHFAKKLFLFLSAHTKWDRTLSASCSGRTLRSVAEQHANTQNAICEADTLVIWYPSTLVMVWVPAFLIRCSRGKNGKYEFIFILFFAPSISSNTFLLPAPLKYGSARSGQELRQHPFPFFFLLTNTSLKTEISSIYKSLLCRFLDLFYITRSGVSQRVIPLNATPGICSAKGCHSENVMLFQNLVPFVAEKISVDLRVRELVVPQCQRGHFNLDDHHTSSVETRCFSIQSTATVGIDEAWGVLFVRGNLQESVCGMKMGEISVSGDLTHRRFISSLCLSFFVDQIVSSVTRASRGCAPKLGDITEQSHEPWENLNSLNLASRLTL